MEELIEFLKSVAVAEIVLFRTQYVTSCHVVYYDCDKLYVHYFEVTDYDAFYDYLMQHFFVSQSLEEIKFVPLGDVILHV